ncbi:hypothetical protein MTO96_031383 [Rhipicephalus appendiculatus]
MKPSGGIRFHLGITVGYELASLLSGANFKIFQMFPVAQVVLVYLVVQCHALHHHTNQVGYPGGGFTGYRAPVAEAAPYGRYDAYESPPQPYSFGYDNVDDFGNRQFRSEQGDANNAKTGSYGYRDANGLYRKVNYVADAYGFRATVDTNEPGTAPGASADAVFNAAPVVPPVPSGNVQGGAPAGFAARVAAPYNAGAYSGYGRYGYNPYASAAGAYGYPPVRTSGVRFSYPQPYSFGYENVDEFSNRQFRSDQGDSNNA